MHLNYTAKVVRFSGETHITRRHAVHVLSAPQSRTPGAAGKFRRLERPAGWEVEWWFFTAVWKW